MSSPRITASRHGNLILSVVIPVYRNEASLETLYCELVAVASERFPDIALEIVFVDDGSSDRSWDVISDLANRDPNRVSAHKLSRNFGQLSAMLAGYDLSRGDAVVSMSADLQDPSHLVGEMVDRWLGGSDVVIAYRARRSDGFLMSATSRFAYAVARRSTPAIPPGGFDFFLMSRRALTLLLQFKGRYRFLQGDLLWLGLPTSLIPYERLARPYGVSGYSFRKRFGNFMDLVVDSSYWPIRMISRTGVVAAALGFVYLMSILFSWARGGTPFSGWAPIMVTLLVLNGLVMMMLGVIGAYLWRIYDQIRERPISVVVASSFAANGARGEERGRIPKTECPN